MERLQCPKIIHGIFHPSLGGITFHHRICRLLISTDTTDISK